jgi:hypothetical protein
VSSAVPLVGGCGVELEFVGDDGSQVRRALSASWDVAFDRLARPMRSFPSFRGQRSGMIGSLSHLVRGAASKQYCSEPERPLQALLDSIEIDHAAQINPARKPHATK